MWDFTHIERMRALLVRVYWLCEEDENPQIPRKIRRKLKIPMEGGGLAHAIWLGEQSIKRYHRRVFALDTVASTN